MAANTAGGRQKGARLTNSQAQEILALNGVLMGRQRIAQAMGQQFNGKRDLYEVLGYPKEIQFETYLEKYTRQDIAGRVVDLPADDTWRRPPIIRVRDEDTSQEAVRNPFLKGLQFLIQRRRLWHYLQRVDRLAGIGRYGVLMMGLTGGEPLNVAVTKRGGQPADVIYFAVFSEGSATINRLVDDPRNERYGLPEEYTLAMGEGLKNETVHWSRTLHVVEDPMEDDVYGRPRLERVFNRLEDMLKVIGGGAEATWKNMDRGLHADVRDGFTLEGQSAQDLENEIDEYIHGLRRFIRTQGMDINALGSEVVDPTGLFGALVGLIAAAADIPQRILIGSERGELASSQDLATWAGQVAFRQSSFAEPVILRPLIDRLIAYGVLPTPEGGEYQVEWPSLFEMSDKERSDVAVNIATAAAKIAPPGAPDLVIGPDEFRERVLGWPKREPEAALLDREDAEAQEEDTLADDNAAGEEEDGE